MFSLLRKRILPKWMVVVDSANPQLGFIQTSISPIKSFSFSSSSVKDELPKSFTVSYLVKSCGLPLETAISASQKLHFKTSERPDSVLALFRDHGLTNTHITRLVRTRPSLLMADPEKTLLPKLEFFHSIGISSTDLPKILFSNPNLLAVSLENQIMPWYNFLKNLVLDEKKFLNAVKRMIRLRIFHTDVRKNLAANISVLRQLGVPESFVLLTVTYQPSVLVKNRDKFDKMIKEVFEMGFNPKKTGFAHAMLVFSCTNKSNREHKMEVYKRWGWSEDDVRLMFKKYPLSMTLSEKKIMSVMDFLVNKMGCQTAVIARYPLVLHFSLEKRVIPRYSVIKVLWLKSLIKNDLSLGAIIQQNEKHFLDRFVTKYQEDVPQLLKVYQGKMSLLELGFGSEEIRGTKLL